MMLIFFFSSRRRHTRFKCDWSSDVCSSDLPACSLHSPSYWEPCRRETMKQQSVEHDSSAFDLPELSRWLDEWDRKAPSRFSKLRKQVAEWDSSERSRAKILKFLGAVKERNLEPELTGYLTDAV